MRDLSDIEELPEEETSKTFFQDTVEEIRKQCNDSYQTSNTDASRTSKTSKSGSFFVPVDPSILQLATAAAGDDDYEDEHGGSGTRFCGSCCDLLRACVIVDIVYIFKNINLIISIWLGMSYVPTTSTTDSLGSYYDDDYYSIINGEESGEGQQQSMMFWILIGKNLAGIFFATIGIFGAVKFHKWLVLSTTIWCCIDVVLSIFTSRWLAVVLAGFFLYPESSLFLALHNGKITIENYKSVKYCCCCKDRCQGND